MQISILFISKLHQRLFRIDPEYYKKDFIQYEKLIKKLDSKPVSEVCYVTDGEHGTVKTSKNGFAKYYGARNVLWGFLSDNNVEYISESDHLRNRRSILKPTDVLISCVGANIGYAALVPQNIGTANIVRNVALLRSKVNKVDNRYLFAYFLSKYGKSLFVRTATGNAQPLASLDNIKEILIPIFSSPFQLAIAEIVALGENYLNQALDIYQQSQTILLSELGILNWKPKHRLSFIKNYSNTQQAVRFDAEYYQPKYAELLEIIENYSKYTCRISSIQNYNARGLQPVYSPDGTLNVISSRHILETDLDYENFERTNSSNWVNQRRARVYEGDILTYTTGANIGRTAVYSSNRPALASNHVNILRIENENPEYVGFVMNSIVGRLQTERLSAGSAQAELYPKNIGSFVIPFIALSKQKEIIEFVSQSRLMKHKSKYILESAKKAVEMAIEKDEEIAIKWLESQIDNIERDN